ncbi:MAG TPA: HD domain-containing protein [Bacillota bacterium]|nr:HD domain-containing protein [Bacillota bacterium]
MPSKDTECKGQRVADLETGQAVRSVFMAKSKQLADFASKPGRYLTFMLFDRTGEIKAIVWDGSESAYNSFEDGDVVYVEGHVTEYRGIPQITVETVHKCRRADYDLSLFLPHTRQDVDRLLRLFTEKANAFTNAYLKNLVLTFLEDSKFAAAYIQAPAAKSIHHAVIGGLIEHTANVVTLCEVVPRLYPLIDTELLIAGAMLHDIGKVVEYTYEGPFDLSDEGKLIGHVVIGERMVSQAIEGIPNFPQSLALKLRHMILSHHGKLEWGSPKRPKTLEAIALHLADYLDASIAQFAEIVEGSSDVEGNWSSYNKRLERQIYL